MADIAVLNSAVRVHFSSALRVLDIVVNIYFECMVQYNGNFSSYKKAL